MGIIDSLKKKAIALVLGQFLRPVIKYINARAWAIATFNLILWIAIYAIPAFHPDLNPLVEKLTLLRDTLLASGLNLDNELFNTGVGFTVVGLLNKIKSLFGKETK